MTKRASPAPARRKPTALRRLASAVGSRVNQGMPSPDRNRLAESYERLAPHLDNILHDDRITCMHAPAYDDAVCPMCVYHRASGFNPKKLIVIVRGALVAELVHMTSHIECVHDDDASQNACSLCQARAEVAAQALIPKENAP